MQSKHEHWNDMDAINTFSMRFFVLSFLSLENNPNAPEQKSPIQSKPKHVELSIKPIEFGENNQTEPKKRTLKFQCNDSMRTMM